MLGVEWQYPQGGRTVLTSDWPLAPPLTQSRPGNNVLLKVAGTRIGGQTSSHNVNPDTALGINAPLTSNGAIAAVGISTRFVDSINTRLCWMWFKEPSLR